MAKYMAWHVFQVMMMSNMLLGKTKNKAYLVELKDNGKTAPEHGKDYNLGITINVNVPTPAPTWAPPPPVCSTKRGPLVHNFLDLNVGWLSLSCMSGGSDRRRRRMKRQAMPKACLSIKRILTGCGRGTDDGTVPNTWADNPLAEKKVSLNMNVVWFKLILSMYSSLLRLIINIFSLRHNVRGSLLAKLHQLLIFLNPSLVATPTHLKEFRRCTFYTPAMVEGICPS